MLEFRGKVNLLTIWQFFIRGQNKIYIVNLNSDIPLWYYKCKLQRNKRFIYLLNFWWLIKHRLVLFRLAKTSEVYSAVENKIISCIFFSKLTMQKTLSIIVKKRFSRIPADEVEFKAFVDSIDTANSISDIKIPPEIEKCLAILCSRLAVKGK